MCFIGPPRASADERKLGTARRDVSGGQLRGTARGDSSGEQLGGTAPGDSSGDSSGGNSGGQLGGTARGDSSGGTVRRDSSGVQFGRTARGDSSRGQLGGSALGTARGDNPGCHPKSVPSHYYTTGCVNFQLFGVGIVKAFSNYRIETQSILVCLITLSASANCKKTIIQHAFPHCCIIGIIFALCFPTLN